MMLQLLPSETDIASLVALNTPGGGGGRHFHIEGDRDVPLDRV